MEGQAGSEEALQRRFSGDGPASLIAEGCCHVPVKKTPKIAIIGAGPSGLCAARHVFAEGSGFTGDMFEQSDSIGGTWQYVEEIGKNKFGQPIHSPIYYGLVANIPKEVMEFPDFPYDVTGKSYLDSEEILDYLKKYAEHFSLYPHIKLNHVVKTVAPVGNSWSLTALNLETNIEHVSLYDAVMVCSGPTSTPLYPTIEGLARFSGKQLHSKSFRRAETYKGQRVLVIGLGPSGLDISYKLIPFAKKVVLSHNFESLKFLKPPAGVTFKPATATMSDKTVTFVDGTSEDVDFVIHCTGYTYNFPFLTKDCGIVVNQYVSPLYLHLFNIEKPTMALLGLMKITPFQYLVDYQARAFLAVLRGDAELPSREAMLQMTEEAIKADLAAGTKRKDIHRLGKRSKPYFESLQQLGNIEAVPEVIYGIYFDGFARALKEPETFRYVAYTVLDDNNFEVKQLERPPPNRPPEPEPEPGKSVESPSDGQTEGDEPPQFTTIQTSMSSDFKEHVTREISTEQTTEVTQTDDTQIIESDEAEIIETTKIVETKVHRRTIEETIVEAIVENSWLETESTVEKLDKPSGDQLGIMTQSHLDDENVVKQR